MAPPSKAYRAGESIEDFCRVCKTDRMHTVVAADADGRPIRVDCGYCHSEHNFRGGARTGARPEAGPPQGPGPAESPATRSAALSGPRRESDRQPFPIVSDR